MPDPNDGIDISNYTTSLTAQQIQTVYDNFGFTIIGIQDSAKARNFQRQLSAMELQYYLDLPRREWEIFPWYAMTKVWIDIEVGCYTRVADVDMDLQLLDNIGCRPGIYCNAESLKVLDGPANPEWGKRPLWYADYNEDRVGPPYSWENKPEVREFPPFFPWNTGQQPEIWQYNSKGFAGINCDLNRRFAPPPPAEEPYVTHFTQYFSDGRKWEIDAVPPPGRA